MSPIRQKGCNSRQLGLQRPLVAHQRHKSRGAHAREDFQDRDDVNWHKHTLCWVDEQGGTTIDYRPVHMYTLTSDVDVVPPKPRVY